MEPTARALVSVCRRMRLGYAGVVSDDAAIATITASKRYAPHPGGLRIRLADADLSIMS